MVDETETQTPAAKTSGKKPDSPATVGGGPERLTVNLGARAVRALAETATLTGDSKTDTVNRALQVYAFLEGVWNNGGQVLVRDSPDSEEMTVVRFF